MNSSTLKQPGTSKWYRVVFTRRWVTYFALTLIFAITCVALSQWQFNRRAEAQQEIQRVLDNYDAQPRALNAVLPDLSAFNDDDKWIPVTVTGEYLADEQFIVRSRPREQQAGVEVLTPLLTTDGHIFIVDRGWLPALDSTDQTYHIPSPPTGEVTVIARLKAGEPAIPGRAAAGNQLATIELPYLATLFDQTTYTGAYGLLESEDPAPTAESPLPAIRPALDEGAHLSYALQWIMFGLLAFIALGWAIRNELRIRNADSSTGNVKQPRRKRAPSEEEIEDALLDQLC